MTTALDARTTVARAFADAFRTGDATATAALYAPDAVVDVNIPTWRFQIQGPDAIQALLQHEEFLPGRTVTAWQEWLTQDGFLVEYEAHAPIGGDDHLWRSMLRVVLDGGRITEQSVYCSGIWDARTIERQRREAPMVRR